MARETSRLVAAELAVGDVAPEPMDSGDSRDVFGAGAAAVGTSEKASIAKLDRRYVTAALMLVMVLASMEQTITSTAMPTIIFELHGLQHYSWVASIYLLACTVSMPLYGRLVDALGRKRVILTAIFLFVISSILAASARTIGQLILFRGLQGLGAGGIMPVVLTILGDIFTLRERAKIQGFFSAVWGTASLAGPALGAFLVNTLGWRSIFFVNLPFGVIAAIVLAWKFQDQEKPHSTDLDLPGAISLAIGCMSLLTLVSGIGAGGWPISFDIAMLGITILATIFFVQHELNAVAPIMPPRLMMQRSIGPSMLCSLLLGVAFLSLDTFVPLYVQGVRGGGAGAAAAVVTPVMLTWALSGIVAAPLVIRWGFRNTAMLGVLLVVVGFSGLLMGAIFEWPRWSLTMVLAITGFGFGPASMSYLLAAQDAVTWQHRGVITGSVQFFRTIGGAVGIGLFGALFNALARPEMHRIHEIGRGLTWVFAGMLVVAMVQLAVSAMMSNKKSSQAVKPAEAIEVIAG